MVDPRTHPGIANSVHDPATASTAAADPYEAERQRLLVATLPLAALVASGATAIYLAAELLKGGIDSGAALGSYLLQLAAPPVAWLFTRDGLRQHVELGALAGDAAFTAAIASRLVLEPTTTISGTAAVLSLTMVATALLIPWRVSVQSAASAITVLVYGGFWFASGRTIESAALLHQVLVPFIATTLSVIGVIALDDARRAAFLRAAELQASERRFRAMVEYNSDVIVLVNRDGTMRYVSPSVRRVLGYDSNALIGTTGFERPPEDVNRIMALLGDLVRRPGGTVAAEYRVRHQDGSWRWIDAVATNLLDEPSVQAIVVNFHDITERKRDESREAARVAAEAANRSKDEFLAVLSHELRTPLSAMLTWTRLLRMGKLDDATAARGLETIERNVRVQTRLIEDLLDVSRIVSGKINLEVAPVQLAAIVDAALDNHTSAAQEKEIALDVRLDPACGAVLGDAARLQQVFSNLLSNAIKFTDGGGRISVRLDRADDRARITISDTGKGITPVALPYIFERFHQEDSSIQRARSGLGLGLAIVRHLVEMHGGSVRAESPGEGRGATFTVELPLTRIRMDAGEAERVRLLIEPGPPPSLRGCRALIVDDEPDARDSLMVALQQCGAEVITAASSSEAMAALERAVPDVLVSDIAMPGADGYALLEQVRALPPERGGGIPAIAVTAYARAEDAERARAAGFDRHLAKPVDPTHLANLVQELVHGRGAGHTPPPVGPH